MRLLRRHIGGRHRVDKVRIYHVLKTQYEPLRIDNVVDVDGFRLTLSAPGPPWVLEGPDQFFLLGIDRNDRLSLCQSRLYLPVDMFKLSVTIRMMSPFQRFGVGLQAVPQVAEQLPYDGATDEMPLMTQCLRQAAQAFAGPPQGGFWIPSRQRLHPALQVSQQAGILFGPFFFGPPQDGESGRGATRSFPTGARFPSNPHGSLASIPRSPWPPH